MRLGQTANDSALGNGKPLEGVRVLALEQMQSLPFATQLLGRLGADVVKVESPRGGDLGRSSAPAMTDPTGRTVGATFLRNNLSKRSICVDLKDPRGRDLVLRLAPRFDVVAENSKAGAMARLGLAFDDVAHVHPQVVYASISGFGNGGDSPYRTWPALATVVEAMSGIYEFRRRDDEPPVPSPVGALGDISAALFTTIGILAALRQRDRTGLPQYVDVSMLDATIAMTDVVANFWSLGLPMGTPAPLIMAGFRASDGWFVLQVGREHQLAALAELIGRPEWTSDPRFASRDNWTDLLEPVIRPAVEMWSAHLTKQQACASLGAVGLPAGPCLTDEELVRDPHVAARSMLVAMPRADGVEQPVLVPGNPVKISTVAEGPEQRVPWLGEHTDSVLRDELALGDDDLSKLHADGVIA